MAYRICYELDRKPFRKWVTAGVCTAAALWCAGSLGIVWSRAAAGEGLYDVLARYVGEMIRNAR